jgi:simple sugar transport system permease protein
MSVGLRLVIEPRLDPPGRVEIAVRLAGGTLLALLAGAAVLAASGADPMLALGALLRGGFGTKAAVFGTLNKAVPIGLCALGIALAARARLINIGAEGQFFFGAFAATGIGLNLPADTPHALAVALILTCGVIGGAVWAGLAAIPRALIGMSEVLSTLMLNYICLLWIGYLVRGPWSDPATFSFPYSPPILAAGQLAALDRAWFGPLHGGFFLLIAATLALVLIDRGTRWGYELRVSGDAPRAALYGGIRAAGIIISGLCAAGALAGLAGAVEVAASTGRLQLGLSPGYGFMGILVAWLAGGRPVPILFVAIAYAGLLNGGFSLQISRIPASISTILQALILLFALGAATLAAYRIRLVRPARAA